jgi:hypothetical protein
VAGVVEPVVVVGVPEAVELELGGAARGVVDVVSGEGYLVVFAISEAGVGLVCVEVCLWMWLLTLSSSGGRRRRKTSWFGRRIQSWRW